MQAENQSADTSARRTAMWTLVLVAFLVSVVSLGAVIHKSNKTTTVAAAGAAPAGPGIPLGSTPPDDFRARDPQAPTFETRSAPVTHKVTLTVEEKQVTIAPGVTQLMWTYNGQVPGPILRGKIGDSFEITVVNNGSMTHSIDFHASKVAPNVMMREIVNGTKFVYKFTADHSGIFMYHCGTPPVLEHIAMGMYGALIIDPPDLAPVDHEYVMVQSELYRSSDPTQPADLTKMLNEQWDAVAFNGYVNQYSSRPIKVGANQKIRVWVMDDGPSENSSFHVIGTIFDTVYKEGAYLLRPDARQGGSQALDLQPAQGGFVEFTFAVPGKYPFVTHKFASATKGAVGVFLAS